MCVLNNVYKFIIMIIITFHFDDCTIDLKQRTIVFIVVAHLHDKTLQDICNTSNSGRDMSCNFICGCMCVEVFISCSGRVSNAVKL